MKKQSGVALLIVILSIAIMSLFISQLQYTRAIDLKISKSSKAKLQAYYLAQSAARFGILRLYLFMNLDNLLNSPSAKSFASMIPAQMRSQVWSFPLPPFPLDGPKSADAKKSLAPGTFISTIKGEGAKIPINLLDANIHRMTNDIANDGADAAAASVRAELENLIQLKFDNDPDFKKKYDSLQPKDLVDALADWVSTTDRSVTGGSKDEIYSHKKPPYKAREDRFGALSEISMIDHWDDTILHTFKDEISLVNVHAKIDCNTMSLDRFKAYSTNLLTDEELALIQKRRTENPFSTRKECETFISTNPDMPDGSSFAFPEALKNFADGTGQRETAFVIEGTGLVGEAKARVKLYVRFDEDTPLAPTQADQQKQQQQQQTQGTTTTTQPGQNPVTPQPSNIKALRVVRYEEGGAT